MTSPSHDELPAGLSEEGYRWQAAMTEDAAEDTPVVRDVQMEGTTAHLIAGRQALQLLEDAERTAAPAPSRPVADASGVRSLARFDVVGRHDPQILFDGESVDRLGRAMDEALQEHVPVWLGRRSIDLHRALTESVSEAVLSWMGIHVTAAQLARVAEDLETLIEGHETPAATLRSLVEDAVRRARSDPFGHDALRVLTGADADAAARPDEQTAVSDVIDLTVLLSGCAWLGAFIPLALQERPDWLLKLAADGRPCDRVAFVRELRRHYPGLLFLDTHALTRFRWYRQHIDEGDRLLLHVAATNHDPRVWINPAEFAPERFLGDDNAASLLAQGSGADDRRFPCAGATARLLLSMTSYLADVPFEMLSPPRFAARRIPTYPTGGPQLAVGSVRDDRAAD